MAYQMTHKEIAEEMGFSIPYIQKLERDALNKLRRDPALLEMLKMCRFEPKEQQ
jgi:hypothetical protein